MHKYLLALWAFFCTAPSLFAQTQNGNAVWYFGRHAALKFAPGQTAPTPLGTNFMNTFEACASVTDAQGNVLFYSDAERIWNSANTVMPNGTDLGGNSSASQGVLAVPAVGSTQQYYVFTVDAKENNLLNSLRYSIVDMRLAGGLGDVARRAVPVALPAGTLATEHLTSVPHANGRDYWILVHGFNNNQFLAYALTASGLSATPVVSSIGPVLSPTITAQTGLLRASPDARKLAITTLLGGLTLFDFNPATGQVSNDISLITLAPGAPILEVRTMGVEFSADGSLLYSHEGATILQFDVLAGSPAAIRASRRSLGTLSNYIGHFLRGPDKRIYIAALNEYAVSVIDDGNSIPNARLLPRSVPLTIPRGPGYSTSAMSQYGLPNYLVGPVAPPIPTEVEDDFQILATPGCVGSPSSFRGYLRSSNRSLRTVSWKFLPDAAEYTGIQIAPVFSTPGTRAVEVTAELSDGNRLVLRRSIQIPPSATLRLRAETPTATLGCGEQAITLTAESNASGTYHWADDAAAPAVRQVSQPGVYRVRFESEAGCVLQDSITVTPPTTPCTLPNIITPNGDLTNQNLVMPGYEPGNWSIAVYNRWGRLVYQQASYHNDWQADGQPAGVYYYHLRHKRSQQELKGWVQVVR